MNKRPWQFLRMLALSAAVLGGNLIFPGSLQAQYYDDYVAPTKFYLSTKKIFQHDEQPQVEMECIGAQEIELRAYKLDDPLAYLQTLADPHRPKYKDNSRRADGGQIIQNTVNDYRRDVYFGLQEELNYNAGRALASALFKTQSGRMRHTFNNPKEVAKSVPPLAKRELLYRELVKFSGDVNSWQYRSLPLPLKENGTYLIEATADGKTAYTVVVISDMSIVVKQDGRQTAVYVVKAKDGTPLAGAAVELYDQSKKLQANGITADDGLVKLDVVPANSLVYVKNGADIALVDPRFYAASQTTGDRLYLFTERPVYKPGQEVFFKGIVRNMTDSGYSTPQNGKIEVVQYDPRGNEKQKLQFDLSANGTFNGSIKLPEEVVSGIHRLVATYKGKQYSGEFNVKSYVKPTYKVEVNMAKKAYHFNEKVTGVITGSYFSGGALGGAAVSYELYRTKFYVPWWVNADYKWYYNDSEVFNSQKEKIGEWTGTLNKDGQFNFEYQLSEGDSDYTYEVVANVTDQQGRPITGRKTFKVTVGEFYLKLLSERLIASPGEKFPVTITARDYGQAPIAEQPIELKVAAYGDKDKKALQILKATTDKDGNAKIDLTIAEAGVYQLYAIAETGVSKVETEQMLMVSNGADDMHYVPNQLQIVVDKRGYKAGDTVKALVVAPFAEGYVLASSEGSFLYETKVLPIKNYTAYYETKIDKTRIPNFMVVAATVQNGQLYQNSSTVIVPPADKFLNVKIAADKKKYLPQSDVTLNLSVTDAAGKPVAAELAVAIVDEAVYSISPELALTMEEFFYEKKRSNIRTTFSQLFRFYGYSEEVAVADGRTLPPHSFGAEKILAKDVRRQFKDTAYWQGVVSSNAQGQATIKFKLPDNLTNWKATAWAVTKDTSVGKGHTYFVSSKDVEVMLSGPAYLVAGDVANYRLVAKNNQDIPAELKLSMTAQNGKLSGDAVNAKVVAAGLSSGDYKVVAGDKGKMTLVAKAEGKKSDAMEVAVPVLASGMRQSLYHGGLLISDKENAASDNFVFDLPAGAELAKASLVINGSSAVLGSLISTLRYLTTYPYGCVEQTMSGFIPDIVATKTMKTLGVGHKELELKLKDYIDAGLNRIAAMQHWNGWGWWGNDMDPNAFMTAHVVYGLSLAKQSGVAVPQQMYDDGIIALQNLLGQPQNPNVMAYGLYALSYSGKNIKSQLKKTSTNGMSVYGKALLALAMAQSGLKEQGTSILDEIISSAKVDAEQKMAHFGSDDEDIFYWFNDPVETTAMVGRAMLALNSTNTELYASIMRWLFSVREGDAWQSTRDTAAVIYFLCEYFEKNGADLPEITMLANLNNQVLGEKTVSGNKLMQEDALNFVAPAGSIKQHNELSVSGIGGQVVFNSELEFYGAAPVAALSKTFAVKRSYYEVDTSSAAYKAGLKVNDLKVGKTYLVEIEVTPQAKNIKDGLDYIMIEDNLPAGVEVIEQDQGLTVDGNSLIAENIHREIRQGQVIFFKTRMLEKQTVRYLVRAVFAGEYTAMPAKASLMYFPKQQGYSASQLMKITK